MNPLDLAIFIFLALCALWGLARGLIGPLIAEALFFAVLIVGFSHSAQVSRATHGIIPSSGVWYWVAVVIAAIVASWLGAQLGRAIRWLPLLGPLDRLAGLLAHLIVGFLIVYLLLAFAIGFGNIYGALAAGSPVTSGQLAQLQKQLQHNPMLKQVLDRSAFAFQTQQLPDGLRQSLRPELASLAAAYRDHVLPYLCTSRLAPGILRSGNGIGLLAFAGKPTVPRCSGA